nr:unnamed protein product [Spirometra erinaceieuropaei]
MLEKSPFQMPREEAGTNDCQEATQTIMYTPDPCSCLTPDSSLALFDCTNMERKYWGLHRSTMHNMTKRARMAYYAATDDPSLPSTSSLVTESSPEPSMPHLSPEVSIVYLRLPREPSTTAYDKRLSQVQHDVECVRKKVDYVAEEIVELRADITQVKDTMAEILKAIQELRRPADARPPSLNLPLCTTEAYKAFVSELENNAGFAQDAIKRLAVTDGRNEKEFVRNLLTTLLGHPLCLSFCWGGARDKQAFVGSPLNGLVIAAIRENATFSNWTVNTIRKSTIDWFHAEEYLIHSPSEDTIPATDMDGLPNMSLEET